MVLIFCRSHFANFKVLHGFMTITMLTATKCKIDGLQKVILDHKLIFSLLLQLKMLTVLLWWFSWVHMCQPLSWRSAWLLCLYKKPIKNLAFGPFFIIIWLHCIICYKAITDSITLSTNFMRFMGPVNS